MAGFEDRGRGLGTKECKQPLDAGNGREMHSLLEPPENNAILPTLVLAP